MANCGFTVEPREIEVAQFEQNCLMLLDEIAATRQPLVITKGRKRLVKRIPVDDESSSSSPIGIDGGIEAAECRSEGIETISGTRRPVSGVTSGASQQRGACWARFDADLATAAPAR